MRARKSDDEFWEADAGKSAPGAPRQGDRTDGPFQRRQGLIRWHRQMLALSCAACALAFVLEELEDGRIAVRGLPQVPLPQTCASRAWLAIKCPGCGLTRSIIHLAAGDWRGSWQRHRLGGAMAAVIMLQVPYRLLALRRPERPLIAPRWQAAFSSTLVALLLANWLLELLAGRVMAL